jgi:hypothetical protein
MEYLLLKFNPSTKTFICREIEIPDLGIISEDIYLISVHQDAKEGKEHYQKIPQARVSLNIVPGYGVTHVDFINSDNNKILISKKLHRKIHPGVPEFIANTLNSRMADITSKNEAVDNLALIIDLKAEIHQLKEQLNNLTDKLSKIAEIVN